MAQVSGKTGREYLRVSLDRSGRSRSTDEQHADNERAAAERGVDLGKPYTDVSVSASRYSRKARDDFAALLSDLESGRFGADELWLWEPSRGSRKVSEWVTLIEACERDGVHIFVTSHGKLYDPTNPRDRRSLLEDAVDSEYESAKTSSRVRRAVIATAAAGRPHGRTTYGYRREYDPATKAFLRQVVDEGQAAVLREVAERFLAGEAFWSLARELTARGIPAPAGGTVWHPTNLARLMKNPAYVGRRMHRGEYVGEAVWPPIFSEAQWAQLQRKLTDPARRTRKEPAVRHLLSGLATCGVCGSRLGMAKQNHGGYRTYVCVKGFCVARKESIMDDYVTGKIIERLAAPDVADLFDSSSDDAAIAALRHDLDEARARLASFEESAAVGTISAGAFGRIEAKISAEIDRLEGELRRSLTPAPLRGLIGVDVAAVWQAMTMPERRDVIRHLATVTLNKSGKGARRLVDGTIVVAFNEHKGT